MRHVRKSRRMNLRRARQQKRRRGANAGKKSAGRHIFNGILWTTSMIMILTLLPAESDAAKKLADLTSENSVLAAAVGKISDFTGSSEAAEAETSEDQSGDQDEEEGADGSEGEVTDIVLTDYEGTQETEQQAKADAQTANVVSETKTENVSDKKGTGNIIIYHTHATESYLPEAASNAHTTQLASTVREAGETLKTQLEAHGFSVVHDMTLHDYPSYNKSYNRSLETVKKLCGAYGNKKLVIDFHRDAATSSGKAKTATIDGKQVAAFCLVVGTENANYDKIRKLAEEITETANQMYPGFAKPIVEKPYKFNGYVSDAYILLEVGNNANTIDEVNAAMPYLANVFAEVVG